MALQPPVCFQPLQLISGLGREHSVELESQELLKLVGQGVMVGALVGVFVGAIEGLVLGALVGVTVG